MSKSATHYICRETALPCPYSPHIEFVGKRHCRVQIHRRETALSCPYSHVSSTIKINTERGHSSAVSLPNICIVFNTKIVLFSTPKSLSVDRHFNPSIYSRRRQTLFDKKRFQSPSNNVIKTKNLTFSKTLGQTTPFSPKIKKTD